MEDKEKSEIMERSLVAGSAVSFSRAVVTPFEIERLMSTKWGRRRNKVKIRSLKKRMADDMLFGIISSGALMKMNGMTLDPALSKKRWDYMPGRWYTSEGKKSPAE